MPVGICGLGSRRLEGCECEQAWPQAGFWTSTDAGVGEAYPGADLRQDTGSAQAGVCAVEPVGGGHVD